MNKTISIAPVRKTIVVKAEPARAFEVFTAFRWWPKSYSILASRSPQADIVVEPRVGGRWFERGEDGSESDWGMVLAWDPPRRLLLTWQIDADFRYDAKIATEVELTFVEDGAGATRIDLEHRGFERFGEMGEKMRASVDTAEGWSGLLESFAKEVVAAA